MRRWSSIAADDARPTTGSAVTHEVGGTIPLQTIRDAEDEAVVLAFEDVGRRVLHGRGRRAGV